MKWVTRERPKIDRLACPWLILHRLASIVRAADTDTLDQSDQAPGLLAISLGLGANIADDQELLKAALPVYDALYTWCQSLSGERHGWNPEAVLEEGRP